MTICPLCNGSGEIKLPSHRQKLMAEKKNAAKALRSKGYSIREIMTIMKYKSPRSVVTLLNK
jgi:hypothetical protein